MGPTQCDWFVTLNKLTTTLTVSSRDKIPIPDVLNPSIIIPTLRDRDQTLPASQYSLWSHRRATPMRAETQSALCSKNTSVTVKCGTPHLPSIVALPNLQSIEQQPPDGCSFSSLSSLARSFACMRMFTSQLL